MIFPNTKFIYNTLHRRLQELAFLNRGVKITIRDERTADGDTFQYARGILEFVEYLNRQRAAASPDIIYIAGEYEGVGLEIAMQYSSEFTGKRALCTSTISTRPRGAPMSLGFPRGAGPAASMPTARKKTCSAI